MDSRNILLKKKLLITVGVAFLSFLNLVYSILYSDGNIGQSILLIVILPILFFVLLSIWDDLYEQKSRMQGIDLAIENNYKELLKITKTLENENKVDLSDKIEELKYENRRLYFSALKE